MMIRCCVLLFYLHNVKIRLRQPATPPISLLFSEEQIIDSCIDTGDGQQDFLIFTSDDHGRRRDKTIGVVERYL